MTRLLGHGEAGIAEAIPQIDQAVKRAFTMQCGWLDYFDTLSRLRFARYADLFLAFHFIQLFRFRAMLVKFIERVTAGDEAVARRGGAIAEGAANFFAL